MANQIKLVISGQLSETSLTEIQTQINELSKKIGVKIPIDTSSAGNNLDKLTQKLKIFQEQAARNVSAMQSQEKYYNSSALSAYDTAVKNLTIDTPNLKNRMQDLNSQWKDIKVNAANATVAHENFITTLVKDTGKMLAWTVAATAIYAPIRSLQSGIEYINQLNTAETNIQMITGMTSEQTQNLTKQYSDLATQLHETTSNMMDASEEFLRAGNNASDTAKLLQASTVMSKIAGQSQADSAQSLISIMNAFHLSADDMMSVVDRMVAVDNVSATSTAEISEALQKTSASAQEAGVSLSTLISWIGEVSSVSRQSADTVGTAFNSIFSRYQNVKAGALSDSNGESLNNVESVLTKLGVAIRSSSGQFKDFNTVLTEVASKWSSYNSVQQAAIATAIAGKQSLVLEYTKTYRDIWQGVALAV